MPERGHHTRLDAALATPPPLEDAAHPRALRVRNTLPLRVEARRQALRRRTQLTFALLLVLPWLLQLAFVIGGNAGSDAPALVELATSGAANFAFFLVFASSGFLLGVVVALFCGDTVASEASWSSLKYLLAGPPVPRARLLVRKLAVALASCVLAVVVLVASGFVAGGVAFGWHAFVTPLAGTLSTGQSLFRLGVVVVYVLTSQLFVASLAFLLGVWTDAPLGAVGGAVVLVVVLDILDAVTALGNWREISPRHYTTAWIDALGDSLVWSGMAKGALVTLAWTAGLLALAFWHFTRKDVVS